MAKMNSRTRNALPSGEFALPAERKYPVNDRAHAANAKARASQQLNAGNLTPSEKAMIDRKADRVLGTTAKHTGQGARHWRSS